MTPILRPLALLAVLLAGSPAAAEMRVDLELVLLADASRSIDDREIAFQRQGYAKAITDPAVVAAITDTRLGRIALAYVEWAEHGGHDIVVDWRVIDGPEAARAFARALGPAPRRARGSNAIGSALQFARRMIVENDIAGMRRVIDFSGDSANSWSGPPVASARSEVLEAGITINALAVLCRDCSGRPVSYDLETAYETGIVGGPGAFVITADSAETFAEAVRRKLILEIAGRAPGPCDGDGPCARLAGRAPGAALD